MPVQPKLTRNLTACDPQRSPEELAKARGRFQRFFVDFADEPDLWPPDYLRVIDAELVYA